MPGDLQNSSELPNSSSESPKDHLERAIKALSGAAAHAGNDGAVIAKVPFLNVTLPIVLSIIAGLAFYDSYATRNRLKQVNLDQVVKASTSIYETSNKLTESAEQVKQLGTDENLTWIHDLPATIEKSQKNLGNLKSDLSGKDGVQTQINDLATVIHRLVDPKTNNIPEFKSSVEAISNQLTAASDTEENASNRLTKTLHEVKDMLTHIQKIVNGGEDQVEVVLTYAPNIPAGVFASESTKVLEDIKKFSASHPKFHISLKVAGENGLLDAKQFGNLFDPIASNMKKVALMSPPARYVFIVSSEKDCPEVRTENSVTADAIVIVDRRKQKSGIESKIVEWSEFCQKCNGQAVVLVCEFEGSNEKIKMKTSSSQALSDTMFRLVAPRWLMPTQIPLHPSTVLPEKASQKVRGEK